MKVFANIVIITTSPEEQKTYVLSTDKEQIVLPKFEITQENRYDILLNMCDFLRENYILATDIEFMPKLVTVHSRELEEDQQEDLQLVYASLVEKSLQRDEENAHWIEFSFLSQDKIVPIIFEAVRSL